MAHTTLSIEASPDQLTDAPELGVLAQIDYGA